MSTLNKNTPRPAALGEGYFYPFRISFKSLKK